MTRIVLALILCLALPASASASPVLHSVGQQDRHLTAMFSGVETIYVASSPDRGTDGRFLEENVEQISILTDGEKGSGQHLSSEQLEPGSYWVLATDYSEFSGVLPLTVPKPRQRFRARIDGGHIASFELKVTPLGESLPYKLCWRAAKGRKCERSEVNGYDWNRAASDDLYLSASDLKLGKRKTTRFVWYVKGKRVASKRVRVRLS